MESLYIGYLPYCIARAGMLALQSFIVTTVYLLNKGLNKYQAERDAIENVIRNSDHAEGAIEYYSKCITRLVRPTTHH